MTSSRYFVRCILSFGFALIIIGCSKNVDYTPPANSTDMAITHYTFGKIIIDGDSFTDDLVILPDGKITSWSFDYTNHIINSKNLEPLINGEVKEIIIGTGHSGQATLAEETLKFLEGLGIKGIKAKELPTGKAVKLFNASEKKGLLVFLHLTC